MPKRSRTFMYTQQIQHLPFSTIEAFQARLENIGVMEFAFIVHDQDMNDGKPVAPHIHAVLRYQNARTVESVSKQISDKSQYIEVWNGNYFNAFSYLVHKTDGASSKFQYPVDAVVSNFDFKSKIETYRSSKQNTNQQSINHILDDIVTGKIRSKEEAYQLLPGSLLSKSVNNINSAFQARQVLEAERWRKDKKASGERIHVIWIFGVAGTGKTRFAIDFFKKLNMKYFKSGSSKDPFQGYSGQHGIILDDLRPNEGLSYADLLRFLDPWNLEAMAASRYFDKGLQADYVIITSPLGPVEFYDSLFTDEMDAFDQLTRRLETVLYFDRQSIMECELMSLNYKLQYRASTSIKVENRWYVPEEEQSEGRFNLSEIQNLFEDEEEINTDE
ncbi:Rep family protein [Fructobacillus fructosus]|uniref:Rep family protein n=1 Tax=Fructobacillus fructosus TaxID=1631 RepID=UPI00200A8F1D|nr:Rep family protein [Fructobacillus fructosus]MCK8638995.1 replication protein [Fructobacillus fructosus]